MDVNVKIVKSHSEKELVLSIRKDVFIRGLNIPEYLNKKAIGKWTKKG